MRNRKKHFDLGGFFEDTWILWLVIAVGIYSSGLVIPTAYAVVLGSENSLWYLLLIIPAALVLVPFILWIVYKIDENIYYE